MIRYHAGMCLLEWMNENQIKDIQAVLENLPRPSKRTEWLNLGGQLMRADRVEKLKTSIKSNSIKSWDQVHSFYQKEGERYPIDKLQHALSALAETDDIKFKDMTSDYFQALLKHTVETAKWITEEIRHSRSKDYENEFRKMVYDNDEEMVAVLGSIENNSFIIGQEKEYLKLKKQIQSILRNWTK